MRACEPRPTAIVSGHGVFVRELCALRCRSGRRERGAAVARTKLKVSKFQSLKKPKIKIRRGTHESLMSSNGTAMSDEQANFFRAELARTPAVWIPLTVQEIESELDRRWKEHAAKSDTFLFDEKLEDEDASTNGVVYCGRVLQGATTKHMYKPSGAADGKRKRDDQGTSSDATSSPSQRVPPEGMVDLECFLGRFKKDTLQNMCEDLQMPVSGNKVDLIRRITMQACHIE